MQADRKFTVEGFWTAPAISGDEYGVLMGDISMAGMVTGSQVECDRQVEAAVMEFAHAAVGVALKDGCMLVSGVDVYTVITWVIDEPEHMFGLN